VATYFEADQKRTILKMRLSNYAWYQSSGLIQATDGFSILITVSTIDQKVKKIIPTS